MNLRDSYTLTGRTISSPLICYNHRARGYTERAALRINAPICFQPLALPPYAEYAPFLYSAVDIQSAGGAQMNSQNKGRRISAWILSGLITLALVGSAIGKLVSAAPVVEMFEKWGLRSHLTLIGVGELVSALLFFIPRTHSLGVLLLSAYLGGAIVTHMQNGEPYIIPAVMLMLVWVVGYLRHPEMLQSFRARSV